MRMSKMPPEIKEKWLKALRSGEYPQTQHQLKRDNCYCCLGVLTDILIKDRVIDGKWFNDCYDGKIFDDEGIQIGDWADELMPSAVCYKTDLSEDPEILLKKEDRSRFKSHIQPKEYATLSSLNDNGFTFEEIAQYIEEQL